MSRKNQRLVAVSWRSVGASFGCVGVVRDARTGRKIAECARVRPNGFGVAAEDDARALATDRGWAVTE